MEKPKFVYVTYINAPPEKVWQALTRPEFTRQYWGETSVESDWKIGSPVKYVNHKGGIDVEGKVLACQPHELLSYTFHSKPLTAVTFRLEPFGTNTRLTVTHEGFEPGSKEYGDTTQGWIALMSSLKSLLETGKPLWATRSEFPGAPEAA